MIKQRPLAGICVPSVLTPDECNKVRMLSKDRLERATTLSMDGKRVRSLTRTCDYGWLNEGDGRWDWLKEKMWMAADEANMFLQCEISGMESLQVLRYRPMQWFKWHFDGYSGSPRKATLVVQLSSPREYFMGGLQLDGYDHQGLDSSKMQGAGTFFPSYLKHRAKAPWWGERWSLVAWFTGPAWK
jgi:hypothetical protein